MTFVRLTATSLVRLMFSQPGYRWLTGAAPMRLPQPKIGGRLIEPLLNHGGFSADSTLVP